MFCEPFKWTVGGFTTVSLTGLSGCVCKIIAVTIVQNRVGGVTLVLGNSVVLN